MSLDYGGPAAHAGNQYHFVYVARRMLHMLLDNSLAMIVVESVSPTEIQMASGKDVFLSVDVSEYYGADDPQSASRIVITQVKYSSTMPDKPWTLKRLTHNEKGVARSSVLGKLSKTFDEYCRHLGDNVSKVEFQIHTNQPIDFRLGRLLKIVNNEIINRTPRDAEQWLQQVEDKDIRNVLDELTGATKYSWHRLMLFIKSWNLSGFSQPSLDENIEELYENTYGLRAKAARLYADRLRQYAHDKAVSGKQHHIYRRDVFIVLDTRPEDFRPAPYSPPDVIGLQPPAQIEELIEHIRSIRKGFILVHGAGGTGKSVTLAQFASAYGSTDAPVIIFDCWAGGEGIRLYKGRYQLNKFVAQIVNELGDAYQTDIIANCQDTPQVLRNRLEIALSIASQKAKSLDHIFVIAVDAIDNAFRAYERAKAETLERDQDFMHLLFDLELPDNCVFLLSTRTENLEYIDLPAETTRFEIKGFSQQTTAHYLLDRIGLEEETIAITIHERTHGIPRILDNLIKRIQKEEARSWTEILENLHAPLTEYYGSACESIFTKANGRHLLGSLLEVEKPTVQLLADVFGVTVTRLQSLVDRIYFGIRITEEGYLEFTDQDFFDFVEVYSQEEQPIIRQLLADYCLQNYQRSPYALRCFARHLCVAQLHNELVATLLGNVLELRLKDISPYEEDVLPDIQYGLFSAIQMRRYGEAAQMLAIAASIKHGSDVFLGLLNKNIVLAAEFGDLSRLEQHLDALPISPESTRNRLTLALELAKIPGNVTAAQYHFELSLSAIEHIREGNQGARPDFYSVEDVLQIILYTSFAKGYQEALKRLKRIRPQTNVLPLYVKYGKAIGQQTSPQSLLEEASKLSAAKRICLTVGVLLSGASFELQESTYFEIANGVRHNKNIRSAVQDDVRDLIEILLQNRAPLSVVLDLLDCWQPRAPISPYNPIEIGTTKEFLRKQAVLQVLGQLDFNPAEYKFPEGTGSTGYLDEVRSEMSRFYPAILAHAKASLDPADVSLRQEIVTSLEAWERALGDPWYTAHWKFSLYCVEALKALAQLTPPPYDGIKQVLDMAKRIYPSVIPKLSEILQILLKHQEYHAFIEQLVDRQVDAISSLSEPARERVEMLLELCAIERQIDRSHAEEIYREARTISATIDEQMPEMLEAIIATTAQIHKENGRLSRTQINAILNLTPGLSDFSDERMNALVPDLVASVANTDVGSALDALWALKSRRSAKGLTAIVQNLLNNQQIDPEYAWPIIFFNGYGSGQLLRQCAELFLKAGKKERLSDALHAWWRTIQQGGYERRLENARHFHNWAQDRNITLSIVHDAAELIENLDRMGLDKESDEIHFQDGFDEFEAEIKASQDQDPQTLLNLIVKTPSTQVKLFSSRRLSTLLHDYVVPRLTTNQKLELSEWISHIEWRYDAFCALEFLVDIAGQVRRNSSAFSKMMGYIAELVSDGISFLTTSMSYYHEGLPSLFGASYIEDASLLELSFRVALDKLSIVNSNNIHGLLSQVVTRLSTQDASDLLDRFLERYTNVEESPSLNLSINPEESLLSGLCRYLGDPEIEVAWQAAYVLIEIALQKPETTLPLILDCAEDTSSDRWMSIREWILFIIQHLSIRQPLSLVPHIDRVLGHALDEDFPHALIRQYAKQTILNVYKEYPRKVPYSAVESVQDVNKAKSHLPPSRDSVNETPYQGLRWEERYGKGEPFHFDTISTMPYWYAPLAHCFGLHRCHVADMAREWVVEKWHITDEDCLSDIRQSRNVFREEDLYSRYHGGYGKTMTLQTYVEHHALYLVAGQMIDTLPAYNDNNWETGWDDWAADNLSLIDPSLPGYYLSHPPARYENYGVFPSDFDKWKQLDPSQLQQEILAEYIADSYIVLNNKSSVSLKGYYTTIEVTSCFVPLATVWSLGRMIQADQDLGELYRLGPEDFDSRISPNTRLAEFDEQIARDGSAITKSGHNSDERFMIDHSHTHFYGGASLHSHDPLWPESGRIYALPSYDFIRSMGLSRTPMSLKYRDSGGQVVAQGEIWHQTYNSSEYVTGRRLVARRNTIEKYLEQRNVGLLLVVYMRRGRPYDYGRRDKEKMVEAVRSFVLTSEGLVSC